MSDSFTFMDPEAKKRLGIVRYQIEINRQNEKDSPNQAVILYCELNIENLKRELDNQGADHEEQE